MKQTRIAHKAFQNDLEAQAFRFHVMGLTCREIGKLLDLSARTVERYSQRNRWKESVSGKAVEQQAHEMHENGKSYAKIAQILNVSKGTVFNYLKRYRANLAAKN